MRPTDPLQALEDAARARDARLTADRRAAHGVVHTPGPIARWIARACGAVEGDVTLLDPACGPGIFLAAALAERAFTPTRASGWDVDEEAIADARRLLGPAFDAAGWPLSLEVTDALGRVPEVPGAAIVVGNPPWTARTASRGVTDALLDDFRRDPEGVPLGERKIGVLSDAYVRFLRWGLAVLERAPRGGVLAMVTSSSYLDGRVHRGMRAYLTRHLDEIAIVDLGGSALVAREGPRDENVFGVRPGAAILVGRRAPGAHARKAEVRAIALRGSRAEKLDGLATLDAATLPLLRVETPLHRFVRTASEGLPSAWPTLEAWMPWSREGVQTNRDPLCVDTDRDRLLARVRAFVASPDRALVRRHFDPEAAAARLAAEDDLAAFVQPIAYRPLDRRWLFAHPALCHRPRPELAAALAHAPLALVTAGKDRGERAFTHLGVVDAIADNCWLSARSSCRARLTPLHRPDGTPNLGPMVRERLGDVTPRQVLAYLAAFFSAPAVRARFDESLRIGPLRAPVPDRPRLLAIARAGEAIVEAFIGAPAALPAAPLVVGHHRLPPSPRAAAIALAQRETDDLVRDLIGSAP